jgi:hypothetical protein
MQRYVRSDCYSAEGSSSSQEIPLEELEVDDSDEIVGVFHFSKELSRTHGVPFKFVVKPVRSLSTVSNHM